MNSQAWGKLKGEVGDTPKREMFQIMHDKGIYIPYVTEEKQGNCVYTVLGDAVKNRLYMSITHDDEVFVGAINSETKENMIEKTPKMHKSDADLCHFLSDIIISVCFQGIPENQILESWDDAFSP